jgi:Pheophorbide a oxygenase
LEQQLYWECGSKVVEVAHIALCLCFQCAWQDHGMFAHQLSSFDLYSASKEHPMQVAEQFEENGWTMTSRVKAVDKVKQRDQSRRGNDAPFSKQTSAKQHQPQPRTSTTTFVAPAVVTMCRRDDLNNTSFLSCFWVSPTGTGRSRFLTATAARAPFALPRWFQHVFLNAFLDQDSLLVASQQPHTLSAELQRYDSSDATTRRLGDGARQSTYVYQSASDRMVRLIDSFWDATLSRAPNRVQTLREMKANGALRKYPPREVVLDLEAQHLRICPDSQDAVRNCKRIMASSAVATAAWCFLRVSGQIAMLPTPFRSISWPIVLALFGGTANFFRKGFYYGHTVEKQRRDLAKIPSKMWADPS